jgi:hypothetical protein
MIYLKRFVLPVLFGFLGAMLFFISWHLYNDHALWHVVLNNATRQQQGEQK